MQRDLPLVPTLVPSILEVRQLHSGLPLWACCCGGRWHGAFTLSRHVSSGLTALERSKGVLAPQPGQCSKGLHGLLLWLLVLPTVLPVMMERKTRPPPPPGVPVKTNRCLALDGDADNFLKFQTLRGRQRIFDVNGRLYPLAHRTGLLATSPDRFGRTTSNPPCKTRSVASRSRCLCIERMMLCTASHRLVPYCSHQCRR